MADNEVFKQIRKFLNNEGVSYIDTPTAIYVNQGVYIYGYYTDEMPTTASHNVRFIKVETLQDFIKEFRSKK